MKKHLTNKDIKITDYKNLNSELPKRHPRDFVVVVVVAVVVVVVVKLNEM